MARFICICNPSIIPAGQEIADMTFTCTFTNSLPAGTLILFDTLSEGRHFDWEIPQASPKAKNNVIWGVLPNKKTISPQLVESPEGFKNRFEFKLPSEIKTNQSFTIHIGTPEKTKTAKGTRAQTFSQRKRVFHLYVDPKGKGDYKDPEVFHVDIKGNTLKTLKVITPSFVSRNKRFDVVVRFEDAYGNLTSHAPEGTLIDLSYENLRENLRWQLFVPETGFITLPNLYFNEEGTYRIRLHNKKTNEVFFSAPIKCFPEGEDSLFWGLLHGESEKHDSTLQIENALRSMRDEKSLDFYATSNFDAEEETSNDEWKLIATQVAEFNETDRFTTFLGSQWVGVAADEGVRQFIYAKDLKPILRKKEMKHNSLKKIYKAYTAKELIAIPTFTMGSGHTFDFKDFNPDFERVVEIYNAWGSSEKTLKEKNPLPIVTKSKNGIKESAEGSLQAALNQNCRFGFVAGGLDDRGIYSHLTEAEQTQYTQGLTAIISGEQTRDALFDALYRRSCYATTGEKILLGLFVAQQPMGSEMNTQEKPGLFYNRYITGFVVGTDILSEVSVIRNGVVLKSFHPNQDELQIEFDDTDPLEEVTISLDNEELPFVYYYLRVTQANGHMAWSSPIWVDHINAPNAKLSTKTKKKK